VDGDDYDGHADDDDDGYSDDDAVTSAGHPLITNTQLERLASIRAPLDDARKARIIVYMKQSLEHAQAAYDATTERKRSPRPSVPNASLAASKFDCAP
jgi:hypothetical protein